MKIKKRPSYIRKSHNRKRLVREWRVKIESALQLMRNITKSKWKNVCSLCGRESCQGYECMPEHIHRRYDLLFIEFFKLIESGNANGDWHSFLKEKGSV